MDSIHNYLEKITIGNDIIENSRISLDNDFIDKILSIEEIKLLNNPNWTHDRKIEFIAGRWAVKEAIFKATNINIVFNKINIFYILDKPTVNLKNYYISISIAHEKKFSIAHCLAIKI